MNGPEIHPADLLLPFSEGWEPWIAFSILAGAVCAAAFYVCAGRALRSLPTYLVLGVAAAPIFGALGQKLPPLPPPLAIGEVDLVVVAAGTWLLLLIARLLHL